MHSHEIRVRALEGIPEILQGMDLAKIVLTSLENAGLHSPKSSASAAVADPIILVVAQKIVSKSEGRLARLDSVTPSPQAEAWAAEYQKDARMVEVVLQQPRRIVRMERGIMIVETHHGFVCANAGVDASNVPAGTVALLPQDPDASAARLRQAAEGALRRQVGVIISDTFGRPWRVGLMNVALGVSGLSPFIDYRGQRDSYGRTLQATVLAVADELAAAAGLVMGKTAGIPAVLIEGFHYVPSAGCGRDLIRSPEDDLFR